MESAGMVLELELAAKNPKPKLDWNSGNYNIREILDKFSLPIVVECDSNNFEEPVAKLAFNIKQPLLLYKRRQVKTFVAQNAEFDPDKGIFVFAGDQLILPEDNTGWFALIKNPEDAVKETEYFCSIKDLEVNGVTKFLIGGTQELIGHQMMFGEFGKRHVTKTVGPGDVLRVAGIRKLTSRYTKKTFFKDKIVTKEEPFLMCIDSLDRNILLSLESKGQFYAVTSKSNLKNRLVQLHEIGETALPCIIKLVYGLAPSSPCLFTGTLVLTSSRIEHSVISSTLINFRNIFLEVEVDTTVRYTVAKNTSSLVNNEGYRHTLDMCKEQAEVYMKQIKVSCVDSDTPETKNSKEGTHSPVQSPPEPPRSLLTSHSLVPARSLLTPHFSVLTRSSLTPHSPVPTRSPLLPHSPVPPRSLLTPHYSVPTRSPLTPHSPVPTRSPLTPHSPVPPRSPLTSHSPVLARSPLTPHSTVPPRSLLTSHSPVPPRSPLTSHSPVPPRSLLTPHSPVPPRSPLTSHSPVLARSPLTSQSTDIHKSKTGRSIKRRSIHAAEVPVVSDVSYKASSDIFHEEGSFTEFNDDSFYCPYDPDDDFRYNPDDDFESNPEMTSSFYLNIDDSVIGDGIYEEVRQEYSSSSYRKYKNETIPPKDNSTRDKIFEHVKIRPKDEIFENVKGIYENVKIRPKDISTENGLDENTDTPPPIPCRNIKAAKSNTGLKPVISRHHKKTIVDTLPLGASAASLESSVNHDSGLDDLDISKLSDLSLDDIAHDLKFHYGFKEDSISKLKRVNVDGRLLATLTNDTLGDNFPNMTKLELKKLALYIDSKSKNTKLLMQDVLNRTC